MPDVLKMNNKIQRIFILLFAGLAIVGCNRNEPPMISALDCSPEERYAGTVFTLKVTASDVDGDELTYLWKAAAGSFTTSDKISEVKWKSPVTGAGETFTISVTVSDGESEVSQDIQILLGDPELGSLSGQVNFANFKIPIEGVTIRISDKSTVSDKNGNFTVTGIPAFTDTLFASKPDFTTVKAVIKIKANDTLKLALEMISVVFTTKLSGIVTDQDGVPQGFTEVLILNPDGSPSKLKTTTNTTGYYRLWYIPHGKRTLIARQEATTDFICLDSKRDYDFQEMELQINLVIKKLSLKGKITDIRDNHIYFYKTFGIITWMTENLSYLPHVGPSTNSSSITPYCYVYGYQGTDVAEAKATENFQKYGALYNLKASFYVCPAGWHLPTIEEWEALEQELSPQAGRKFKSSTGWSNSGNGDNSSGMNAVPAGSIDPKGQFYGLGAFTLYSTSSELSGVPYFAGVSSQSNDLYFMSGKASGVSSVRCVRDRNN
jgi:uncharacterized protein (TIGR02145 family)